MFKDGSYASRINVNEFIILLYDGLSTDRYEVYDEAKTLRSSGIRTIPIGIGPNVAHEELFHVAYTNNFVYKYEHYKDALNQLVALTIDQSCSGLYHNIDDIRIKGLNNMKYLALLQMSQRLNISFII